MQYNTINLQYILVGPLQREESLQITFNLTFLSWSDGTLPGWQHPNSCCCHNLRLSVTRSPPNWTPMRKYKFWVFSNTLPRDLYWLYIVICSEVFHIWSNGSKEKRKRDFSGPLLTGWDEGKIYVFPRHFYYFYYLLLNSQFTHLSPWFYSAKSHVSGKNIGHSTLSHPYVEIGYNWVKFYRPVSCQKCFNAYLIQNSCLMFALYLNSFSGLHICTSSQLYKLKSKKFFKKNWMCRT